jgi:hypothetical protein
MPKSNTNPFAVKGMQPFHLVKPMKATLKPHDRASMQGLKLPSGQKTAPRMKPMPLPGKSRGR